MDGAIGCASVTFGEMDMAAQKTCIENRCTDAMLSNNRVYLVAMDSPNAMFHHPVACFSGRDMQFV